MKKYIITVVLSVFSIISVAAQKSDPTISKLYSQYIQIKDALASDNADKTSQAAINFIKTAGTIDAKLLSEGNINALRKDASAISESRNIQKQRQYFYNLSDNMIAITKKFKLSDKSAFVQYCPMAEGSWLSNEKKIVNPYYGSSMLSCGSVKSEIKN
jgi:DNA-binding transcriptional regulator WhiA